MAFPATQPNPIAQMLDTCIAQHCPSDGPWVVSVTGSGGKTTTIEQLANYWAAQGKRVLVSTTTRMAHPQAHTYPFEFFCLLKRDQRILPDAHEGATTFFGVDSNAKLAPVDSQLLQDSLGRFDRVLLEADGARNLPLKIHAERDPVIPDYTNVVIALLGLSALGQPLDERVMYLSERYRKLTGDKSVSVSEETYRTLLEHPEGVFKRCVALPVVVCCNQSDAIDSIRAKQVLEAMRSQWKGRPFTLSALSWQEGTCNYYEDVAGSISPERSIG